MRFIFPTAKKRRAKLYNRATINQWFDNVLIDVQDNHGMTNEEAGWQLEGLRESRAHVVRIIEQEVRTIGAANVLIGGLRQGCAMSLHVLLSYEGCSDDVAPLGGFVGMSGWLPFVHDTDAMLHARDASKHDLNEEDDPFASRNESRADTPKSSRLDNDVPTAAQVCNFV